MFEKLFKLSEKKTNIKTELIAGLTTFLTMAYILPVNANMLSATGMSFNAVFFATALSSAFASIVMGIYANYPVALAPGMGVNAFFTFTVCMTYGLSWQAALAAVFISGIIFLIISVTNIRKMVIQAIPQQLKLAIGAGIGFFIAFIGFKNAGIIVSNPSTFVSLGNLADPVVLLALFGLVITIVFICRKVKAAVFYGLALTAIVGVVAGLCGVSGMPALPTSWDFSLDMSAVGGFAQGFGELFADSRWMVIIFSFLFVDFFDTAGTLLAIGNRIGIVKEDGELVDVEKALFADAAGTVFGAMLGTSTVTSFVESSSGVEAGGRTGLTAVTTGVLFLVSLILSPILSIVTSAVTAPALIVVGILMASQLKGIEWDDFTYAAPAFVTVIMMILTYSISDGMALGFVTYAVTMIASGRIKEINPIIWALLVIFVIYFAV